MVGRITAGHSPLVVSDEAERRVRVPVLRAEWLTQAFIHWPYQPDHVQALLPDGLAADQHDGAAWVSLTPFVMANLRPLGLSVSVPPRLAQSHRVFPKTFPETNLRTYVRGPDGRDGLWFLSNEVGSALMLGAWTLGVPYHLGDLSVSASDDVVSYVGSRRGGWPSYRLVMRPGEAITPSDRDVWLTSRWRAYSRRLGVIWQTPVDHEPWQLADATVESLRETLTTAAGLPEPDGEPVVHFSSGVHRVRLGISRPLRRGT